VQSLWHNISVALAYSEEPENMAERLLTVGGPTSNTLWFSGVSDCCELAEAGEWCHSVLLPMTLTFSQ
jgi:hypothetical protein